jgi:hypothetical protein
MIRSISGLWSSVLGMSATRGSAIASLTELGRPRPDDVADDPLALDDLVGPDGVGQLAQREDRPETAGLAVGEIERGRVGAEQRLDPLADPFEDSLDIERRRDLLADLGQGGHLVAAAVGLLVEPRVLDRDADVRRDRREQPGVRLAEAALLGRALDADRRRSPVAREDRHAEIRLRERADAAVPDRLPVGLAG